MTVDTGFISNVLAQGRAEEETEVINSGPEDSDVNNPNEKEDGVIVTANLSSNTDFHRWSPSGSWIRDLLHFVGPGWFVCIAYVDPGNYQADIQAGATSRYTLLFALWWSSILSIYVQMLCVRLAYYGQVTLAEAQAKDLRCRANNATGFVANWRRYLNWFLAEFSTVITDLPEVIGIGVALNVFFGLPYWVGVVLSLFTTMIFLLLMNFGLRSLEVLICLFVGIMSIALWVEMDSVGVDTNAFFKGWALPDMKQQDMFALTGILGSIVMPHNLYLHSAACMSRRVERDEDVVRQAVKWCSIEPIIPIIVSFFINMAVVSISAESVYGKAKHAENVGLTDFCNYFKKFGNWGCSLWAIALLAAGQSSAITTTFTGQYVMDGFLNIKLSVSKRAIITRLAAITPCIIVSVLFPNDLNQLVNIVNSALSFLLPFALTPLVKYNCSEKFMGKHAASGCEKYLLYTLVVLVYIINAVAISLEGGGYFGNSVHKQEMSTSKFFGILLEVGLQIFYLWWNLDCLLTPVSAPMRPLEEERPWDDQFAQHTIT